MTRVAQPGGQTVTTCLSLEAIADSTAYVLVDLSDTTNFPHKTGTTAIFLQGIRGWTEKASDGVYDIWVGVIVEVDATDGTAKFIECFHLEAVGNSTDSTDRCVFARDYTTIGNPRGLNLLVNADTAGAEVLRYILTNSEQADSSNWQTDTGLASPAGAAAGATGKPGVGDLVMYVEEVSGTGTLDLFISVDYQTV